MNAPKPRTEPRTTMQFEDFGSGSATPPPRPAIAPSPPPASPPPSVPASADGGGTNERFAALCAAVGAAVKGDFTVPLPLQGHDRLTLLAKQLDLLFKRAQACAPASPATTQPTGAGADLAHENARLRYLIANTPAIIYSSVPTGDGKMTFVSDNAKRLLDYEIGRASCRERV